MSCLDKIKQAQRLIEASRRIGEVNMLPLLIRLLRQVQQQRQYLVDMQHLIYEC